MAVQLSWTSVVFVAVQSLKGDSTSKKRLVSSKIIRRSDGDQDEDELNMTLQFCSLYSIWTYGDVMAGAEMAISTTEPGMHGTTTSHGLQVDSCLLYYVVSGISRGRIHDQEVHAL